MPKTNKIVPMPTTPPKNHPSVTADNSMMVLIKGIEVFVFFWRQMGIGPNRVT